MQVKKELAARIVTDFHSAADARQAAEDFAREVQQGAEPSDIETVSLSTPERLAQALVMAGLAQSRTQAERLIKERAVEVNGEVCTNPGRTLGQGTYPLRVGKKWKRVVIK